MAEVVLPPAGVVAHTLVMAAVMAAMAKMQLMAAAAAAQVDTPAMAVMAAQLMVQMALAAAVAAAQSLVALLITPAAAAALELTGKEAMASEQLHIVIAEQAVLAVRRQPLLVTLGVNLTAVVAAAATKTSKVAQAQMALFVLSGVQAEHSRQQIQRMYRRLTWI